VRSQFVLHGRLVVDRELGLRVIADRDGRTVRVHDARGNVPTYSNMVVTTRRAGLADTIRCMAATLQDRETPNVRGK